MGMRACTHTAKISCAHSRSTCKPEQGEEEEVVVVVVEVADKGAKAATGGEDEEGVGVVCARGGSVWDREAAGGAGVRGGGQHDGGGGEVVRRVTRPWRSFIAATRGTGSTPHSPSAPATRLRITVLAAQTTCNTRAASSRTSPRACPPPHIPHRV